MGPSLRPCVSLSFPICKGGMMVQVLNNDSAGEQGKARTDSSGDADVLAGR